MRKWRKQRGRKGLVRETLALVHVFKRPTKTRLKGFAEVTGKRKLLKPQA